MLLQRCQVSDDGFSVIGTAGATNLVELGVQQLFKTYSAAPDARVMELDLECQEFIEQRCHGRASFVRPNVRAKLPAEAGTVSPG